MKMTLKDLGYALEGRTEAQIWKYEKGLDRIPACLLVDVAWKLRAPISYFFVGLNPRKQDKLSLDEALTLAESFAALPNLHKVAGLDAEKRKALSAMTDALAGMK